MLSLVQTTLTVGGNVEIIKRPTGQRSHSCIRFVYAMGFNQQLTERITLTLKLDELLTDD